MPMIARPEVVDEVYYPSSDGKPMAETQIHIRTIRWLIDAMEDYLAERPDMYVAADLFLYWEKGNPSACTAPDVMVIPGVDKRVRRSFMVWKEGGAIPSVVIEVASENTWREHLRKNQGHYERLGVAEFFLYDPEDLYLEAPLLGYRLRGNRYERLEADSENAMICEGLNLRLVPEGWMLRLIDLATGRPILSEVEKREEERLRADSAVQKMDEMAAEIARLKAILERSAAAQS